MTPGQIGWCRDVDYGNLPQWLTLGLGSIVAGFTIFGILTARSAYIEDVRTRKFAQARLVYAEVAKVYASRVLGQEMNIPLEGDPKQVDSLIVPGLGSSPLSANFSIWNHDKMVEIRSKESLIRVYVVKIHNHSDEIISEVRVVLHDDGGVEVPSFVRVREGNFVAPHKTVEKLMVIRRQDDEAGRAFIKLKVDVHFRDSTGKRWVRNGTEPVREALDSEVQSLTGSDERIYSATTATQ